MPSEEAELERIFRRLDALYEEGDLAAARKEVARAKKRFPGSVDVREMEAILAVEEGRFEDALVLLDEILAQDFCVSLAQERASVLMELGRFEEALSSLQKLLPQADEREAVAGIHHDMGLCLDRQGKAEKADWHFRKAARSSPEAYPAPPRLEAGEFEALVADALDSIPAAFQPYLKQVVVLVEDYPSPSEQDPYLLGLYLGVPRTERAHEAKEDMDHILIFKRNHELMHSSREDLREEVRKTVVHEIAHHFGLAEDEMGDYT